MKQDILHLIITFCTTAKWKYQINTEKYWHYAIYDHSVQVGICNLGGEDWLLAAVMQKVAIMERTFEEKSIWGGEIDMTIVCRWLL